LFDIKKQIIDIKKRYGANTHITIISDNIIIPWKLLPIFNYIQYSKEIQEGRFPLSIFEDKIFSQCVLDQSIVRQLPFLKAGIVSTVVENIWNASCSNTVEGLNNSLEEARKESRLIAPAIHELVSTILLAFPAYKPEEVYSMDFNTLTKRAIDAEIKLLHSNIIQEPIRFEPLHQEDAQEILQQPKVDPKEIWERQHNIDRKKKERPRRRGIDNLFKDLHRKDEKPKEEKKEKLSSNIIDALDKGLPPVVNEKESKQAVFHGSGNDIIDRDIHTHNMINEAKVIYADVIEELKKKREKFKKNK